MSTPALTTRAAAPLGAGQHLDVAERGLHLAAVIGERFNDLREGLSVVFDDQYVRHAFFQK